MKTTVDLPTSLLREAQETARQQGTTLKALIEAGLRKVLAQRARDPQFRLPDVSVGGHGLQEEFRGGSWEQVRDAIYGHSS